MGETASHLTVLCAYDASSLVKHPARRDRAETVNERPRKMKQSGHFEFFKLIAILLFVVFSGVQGAQAQDFAGPSLSGSDSMAVPGMVGNAAAGAGGGYGGNSYNPGMPNYSGNRRNNLNAAALNANGFGQGGFNGGGMVQPGLNEPPAIGFEMGHRGVANGGNNGNQTAVKLPASNCCGKVSRNSAYYANDYMNNGYALIAPGGAPGVSLGGGTANGGAANSFANSRMMMQMNQRAGRGQ